MTDTNLSVSAPRPSGLRGLFGGATHTREQLDNVWTPQGTDSYVPIPYGLLINTVDRVLQDNGLTIANEAYQLVKPVKNDRGEKMHGAFGQMFGLLNLAELGNDRGDVGFAVGVRSSHDQSLAAGLCAGSNVFVCSNLCFSAEYVMSRKHTGKAITDLPVLLDAIIKQFPEARAAQDRMFDVLRDTSLTEKQALWLVYQGVKNQAINARDVVPIMDELLCVESDRNRVQHANVNSQNEQVDELTAWRLYNAGTEVAKGIQKKNGITASTRGLQWHSLFGRIGNGESVDSI